MVQQTINVGAALNDKTGDPIRTGGQKINANFTELYTRCPDLLSGMLAADATSHNYRVAVIGDISFAAQANGLATLDSGGKLATAQIPAALVGALQYQGTWNATTNVPAIASGVGTKGQFYVVATAGSTTIDGNSIWNIGDWLAYDGTKWDKIDNYQDVTSVAGKVGAVALVVGDISGAAPLASPAFTGTPAAPTPGTNVNTTQVPTCAWVNTWYAPLASPTFTGTPAAPTPTGGDSSTKLATTAFVGSAIGALAQHGQCRLVYTDASHVTLKPYNGNKLIVGGAQQSIPSAGVAGAVTGLTVATVYYVYAYMVSSTVTLEFSTTTHATDATTGVEIKSGDSTRTLVGMVYPITGPAFADSATQRLVRSWFNSPKISGQNKFTVTRSYASATTGEVNSEIRVQFLSWSSDAIGVFISGAWQSTSGTQTNDAYVGIDATAYTQTQSSTNLLIPISISAVQGGLSEGFHYATLLAAAESSASINFYSLCAVSIRI